MDLSCYNSYYEISLKKIAQNYQKIRNYTGANIMPVVKANAYGMGLVALADFFDKTFHVDILACAHVSEGVKLRENNILRPDILVMGPALPHTMQSVVHHRLQTPLFTAEGAAALNSAAAAQGKIAQVHIKIDTGMNRIGVRAGQDLEDLLDVLPQFKHIQVVGVFTHFAQADVRQDAFTLRQFSLFHQAVEQIKTRGLQLQYIHCCNTCAAEWYKQAIAYSTHIRVGSLVYGYSDLADESNPIEVCEALSFRAFITGIKTVHPGETVGYGGFFKPAAPTRIATISVGFGDGLYCLMGKKQAPVLVNGIRTKMLDACMDQSFVDITGVDCQVGDTVTLFGCSEEGICLPPQKYTPLGQIYTAYMCTASERVGRIYTID